MISGQWSNASTQKAVGQPCLSGVNVSQLLCVPGFAWNTSSIACASPAVGRRETRRSLVSTDVILFCLLAILGLGPASVCGEPPSGTFGGLGGIGGLCDAQPVHDSLVDAVRRFHVH